MQGMLARFVSSPIRPFQPSVASISFAFAGAGPTRTREGISQRISTQPHPSGKEQSDRSSWRRVEVRFLVFLCFSFGYRVFAFAVPRQQRTENARQNQSIIASHKALRVEESQDSLPCFHNFCSGRARETSVLVVLVARAHRLAASASDGPSLL